MKRGFAAACTGVLLAQAALLVAAQPASVPQATSADGRWRAIAQEHAVAIVDTGTGRRATTLRARALDGDGPSAVAEIHHAASRRSFVIAFETLRELWEVSYDPQAEPIHDGYVHDYRMGEAIAIPGFLNPRRTKLDTPVHGLVFDRSQGFVLGRAADRPDGRAVLQVWQLDIRRRIGERVVDGDPDTAQARSQWRDGREFVEVPDRAGGASTLIEWQRP